MQYVKGMLPNAYVMREGFHADLCQVTVCDAHLHPSLLQQFLQRNHQAQTMSLCIKCPSRHAALKVHADTALLVHVLTWKYRLEKPVGELVQGPSKLQG